MPAYLVALRQVTDTEKMRLYIARIVPNYANGTIRPTIGPWTNFGRSAARKS